MIALAALRSLLFALDSCPLCGSSSSLDRAPRRPVDHLVKHLMTCRRYHCLSCGWEGLLRGGVRTRRDGHRD